jgi:hypothetical protein
MLDGVRRARARETSWRWPWERLEPLRGYVSLGFIVYQVNDVNGALLGTERGRGVKRKRKEAGSVRIGVAGRGVVMHANSAELRRFTRETWWKVNGKRNKEGNTNPSWIFASRPPSMLVT